MADLLTDFENELNRKVWWHNFWERFCITGYSIILIFIITRGLIGIIQIIFT